MVYCKYLSNIATVSSLSLLLTCISAQASEGQDFEKLDSEETSNLDMKNTERTHNNDNVIFGPANLTYEINAKKLLELDVVSNTDKDIGKIEDLVLNHNEKITYVIVSAGGMLGIGDKLVAIPLDDMNINKKEGKVITNLSEKQLEELPEFKFEYVGNRNYQTDNRPAASGTNSKYSAANIDFDINAKKLFDMHVVDQNGKKLGGIEDLILNNKNKITYAILSVGGVLGVGDKLVAVSFHGLNVVDDKIMLEVTEKQLEQAPEFKFNKS